MKLLIKVFIVGGLEWSTIFGAEELQIARREDSASIRKPHPTGSS